MKKLTALIIAMLLVLSVLPLSAFAKTVEQPKLVNANVEFDDDGSDGYSGDYVVIYNPSTSSSATASTGNMAGLIETTVGGNSIGYEPDRAVMDRPYKLDVDGIIAEQNEAAGIPANPVTDGAVIATSFNVGDTHNFQINSTYCPLPSTSVQFKVLAKGDHCYIWTPTSTAANVYPLDQIDESFGDMAAAEFDSKFELMQSSFGDHSNGTNGDGRLNILYYNIDDGWQPGEGYVAGFFSSSDLYYNGMPILNIDTYPGVYYERVNGEVIIDLESTYGTMVHEYQHLINYSAGGTDTWINECMSAAAEEICYPGSSVVSRIQSWLNYRFSTNNDWLNPPTEHEYTSAYSLHKGYSMYSWSNYLNTNDLLALYAQVSFFAQYIYTQHGNSTFRALLEKLTDGFSFPNALQNVTGQNASDFVRNFRIALTANTTQEIEDGIYGFVPQEGYDPSQYHDVENMYDLLAPLVFTGSSCSISGGGAITVKPVGGIYNPPAGAASSLQYMGITIHDQPLEPVALTTLTLDPASIDMYAGGYAVISALREPVNANNYEISWTSSNEAIATVVGNNRKATVSAVAIGTAVITARAHDLINDVYYTAQTLVNVKGVPSFNEAANVENGTVEFNNSVGTYHWVVDPISDPGRVSVRSDNRGVNSSDSAFTVTVQLNSGDVVSFDWKVSSEASYDKLNFYVDNSVRNTIHGEQDWATVSFTATATRSYTFKWEFHKDVSTHTGADCGWVDNISIPGYINEEPDYLPGDVNMNGTVEMADALMALRAAMGILELTELQTLIADMDENGTIAVSDALSIMRISMGID